MRIKVRVTPPCVNRRREALRRLGAWAMTPAILPVLLPRANAAEDTHEGIHSLRGEVLVDGRPAYTGQRIGTGQEVVTPAGSEATFVIGDDAFLQYGDSRFVVENHRGAVVYRYISGRLLSVFGGGWNRTLLTPTASIALRNSACYIEAEPEAAPARTCFCLCRGEATIIPIVDANKRRVVRTRHHDYPIYIRAQRGPWMIVPANGIEDHDAKRMTLESLLKRAAQPSAHSVAAR